MLEFDAAISYFCPFLLFGIAKPNLLGYYSHKREIAMPVVARYKGWAIVIWFGDHAPAHVHIIKDEIVVRVAIETVEVLSIKGKISSSEIKHLQKFITENKDDLIKQWNNAQG